MAKEKVSVTVDSEVVEAARAEAELEHTNLSAYVERCVREATATARFARASQWRERHVPAGLDERMARLHAASLRGDTEPPQ